MRSLYVTKLCTAAVIAVQLRSCCAILPVCLKDKRKTIQRNLICLALEQLIFFLSVLEIEKGYLILPLRIDDMSDTNADVVASGPAPSP